MHCTALHALNPKSTLLVDKVGKLSHFDRVDVSDLHCASFSNILLKVDGFGYPLQFLKNLWLEPQTLPSRCGEW